MSIHCNTVSPHSNMIMYLDAQNPRSYSGTGSTWYDISGNNNHATLYNSPTYGNGVFTFNGSTQYVRTANTLNLSAYNKITVIMNLKIDSYASLGFLYEFSENYASKTDTFMADIKDIGGDIFCSMRGPTGVYNTGYISQTYMNDLAWKTYAVTYDRTVTSTLGEAAYVNGRSVPISVYAGQTGNLNSSAFGNWNLYLFSSAGSSYFVPGKLSTFAIFGTLIDSTGIQTQYQAFRDRYGI